MNEHMSAGRVVEILNERKWRGREDWKWDHAYVADQPLRIRIGSGTKNLPSIRLDVEDARIIASYLELTREGSWYWALEQMRLDRYVKRAGWSAGIGTCGGGLQWRVGLWSDYQLTLEDFDALDWQIVDGVDGEGER